MSIRALTENTRVTLAVAISVIVAVAGGGYSLGRVSQRVDNHETRLAGVEQKQLSTDQWAIDTAAVLSRLETLAGEQAKRIDAVQLGDKR